MKVVGLTGGIASGKTTTSQLLVAQGFAIVDCDKIAHDVVRKGRWGWRRVVAAFGHDILDERGEIDRAKLGRLVFQNTELRRRLNKATHLPVALEILRQLAWCWLRCRQVVILDMPLLFETGMHRWTHPVVLVYVDEGTQVRRIIARDGLTAEEAADRVSSQLPLKDKMARADVLIHNEGSLQQLQQQVTDLGTHLRRIAGWKQWVVSPLAVGAGLLVIGAGLKLK